jgi:hypothetical protein
LHVWISHDNDLVDLTLAPAKPASQGKTEASQGEVIHTNKKHPFLTVEKGFLPVGQIKLGMHVRRADGSIGTVTGWKLIPGILTMYNLEVAQDHTFTVGNGQWVVHNSDCGGEIESQFPGDYLSQKADMVGTPGSVKSGVYVNDLGVAEPWLAQYDEYGRLQGRTDISIGNKVENYDAIHYHEYTYGEVQGNNAPLKGSALGKNGQPFGASYSGSADHMPGVYDPFGP